MALTKKARKLLIDSKKLLRNNPPKTLVQLVLAQALAVLIKIVEKDK